MHGARRLPMMGSSTISSCRLSTMATAFWLHAQSADGRADQNSYAMGLKSDAMQVDGKQISAIKEGLLCLIGVKAGDTAKDSDYM